MRNVYFVQVFFNQKEIARYSFPCDSRLIKSRLKDHVKGYCRLLQRKGIAVNIGLVARATNTDIASHEVQKTIVV